ncbi:MAG: RelA/SpoT family protein [Bacteroidales bacterium]|nr:RelA/SpoT family protein [Bacteroidales bacterium]
MIKFAKGKESISMEFDYSSVEPEVQILFDQLIQASQGKEDTPERIRLIHQAFELAYTAHHGIKRKSGEPYIIHPLHVALIVSNEMGLGVKSIVAAILHDVVEDTEYTLDNIEELFGSQIAGMVDGLTKLTGIFYQDRSVQAENFKKLLMTLIKDVRVILIKIADRLHNMRTLDSMPENKQIKIASETLYLFAPLAQRMGLYAIKSELEDLSFQYRHPEIHQELSRKMDILKKPTSVFLAGFLPPIQEKLAAEGINCDIQIVYRTPPSIYRKIKRSGLSFDELHDLFIVRIIFNPNEDYQEKVQYWNIYSIITEIYNPKPERIRDLLSNPKTNGYEALHVTVIGEKGQQVEIQIRSYNMHIIAERGWVAYWKEKGLKSQESVINQWVEEIRKELDSDQDAMEFVEEFKANLFSQEIRVFTHKGHLKKIPKGSTIIDFAYLIHSELGNHCIGAKVNHKLVGRNYILKQGDQIEVLTADSQQPEISWLDFAHTAKAKSRIHDGIKDNRRALVQSGKDMLKEVLAELNRGMDKPEFKEMIEHFKLTQREDFYSLLGSQEIDREQLTRYLKRSVRNKLIKYWQLKVMNLGKKSIPVSEKSETSPLDDPFEEQPEFILANCCNPIPGDDAIGFLTENNITQIHKKDCPIATDLLSHQGDKVIAVQWKSMRMMSYLATIKLAGIDNLGLVGNITQVISFESKVNMRAIRFETNQGVFGGEIELYIYNSDDLANLISKLQKIKGVESIVRIS